MKSIYYSAAWTDSGWLLGCGHDHETIIEAASCIPCAEGYVVCIENGVMRSLKTEESYDCLNSDSNKQTSTEECATTIS